MSEQENIEVVNAIFEMVAGNKLERTPEYFHEDYLAEIPGMPALLNREQAAKFTENFVSAFPDLQIKQLQLIAKGDDVVARWSMTGTHTAPLPLFDGDALAPAGKLVSLSGCHIYNFRDGKVAFAYQYMDMAVVLGQLGLLPAMGEVREVSGSS
jgi:predicted ester cyclase